MRRRRSRAAARTDGDDVRLREGAWLGCQFRVDGKPCWSESVSNNFRSANSANRH